MSLKIMVAKEKLGDDVYSFWIWTAWKKLTKVQKKFFLLANLIVKTQKCCLDWNIDWWTSIYYGFNLFRF